jgi:hypothetical protein
MPATNPFLTRLSTPRDQKGVAVVEFALVAVMFFTLVFGIIEVARAMYICNTLQEVTRLAAAKAVNADFSDSAALQTIRQKSIFRDSPGMLVFAEPISDQHVRIDYMYIPQNATAPVAITSALPSSPEQNRLNCTRDANAADCVRLVRVRICKPNGGANCEPVPYQTLVSLIPLSFLLPTATTIAKVETLGMAPKVSNP